RRGKLLQAGLEALKPERRQGRLALKDDHVRQTLEKGPAIVPEPPESTHAVTPANAGVQCLSGRRGQRRWVPAFAGTTEQGQGVPTPAIWSRASRRSAGGT